MCVGGEAGHSLVYKSSFFAHLLAVVDLDLVVVLKDQIGSSTTCPTDWHRSVVF